jgi:hypothetical protein
MVAYVRTTGYYADSYGGSGLEHQVIVLVEGVVCTLRMQIWLNSHKVTKPMKKSPKRAWTLGCRCNSGCSTSKSVLPGAIPLK